MTPQILISGSIPILPLMGAAINGFLGQAFVEESGVGGCARIFCGAALLHGVDSGSQLLVPVGCLITLTSPTGFAREVSG
jgi:hypothetical protein